MAGWAHHRGRAAALALTGVDTDQLIPARFMSAPRSAGYGQYLLHDLRAEGGLALDRPEASGASILIARADFGVGSSREAAVYALMDAGFHAVIAPSFGDIFAANAVNNGLLPARVAPEAAERLIAAAPLDLAVDLETERIAGAGFDVAFELDPVWRRKLINGWDDIDLTAAQSDAIDAFAASRRAARPWLWPPEVT